jgi:hypothetical protein
MTNDNDLIRRGDALNEIKKSSDNARAKMAETHFCDEAMEWSAVVSHLDIVASAIAALPAAPVGVKVKPLEWTTEAGVGGEIFFETKCPITNLRYVALGEQDRKAVDAKRSDRVLAALTSSPAPTLEDAMAATGAAKIIQERIDDIFREEGVRVPDTNVTHLSEWAEAVVEELQCILAALAALKGGAECE